MASFVRNEEWEVISFRIYRHEYKYACCRESQAAKTTNDERARLCFIAEPWTILEASLVMRRKPLYYLLNLLLPVCSFL